MDYLVRESQYKKVCYAYLNSLRMLKLVSKTGQVTCFKYSEHDNLCQLSIHSFEYKGKVGRILFINEFFLDDHDKIFGYHYDPRPFIKTWVEEQLGGVEIGTVDMVDPRHQSNYRLNFVYSYDDDEEEENDEVYQELETFFSQQFSNIKRRSYGGGLLWTKDGNQILQYHNRYFVVSNEIYDNITNEFEIDDSHLEELLLEFLKKKFPTLRASGLRFN